ncbi:MAG: DUF1501 domain-containing protein [Isosphaeraceae bacterium]
MKEFDPSRRDFFKKAAGLGALSALGIGSNAFAFGRFDEPDKDLPAPEPTADAMILLWMAGGQAHTETWDPKTYTPFEKGMEAKKVMTTFRSIPTSVDGVKLSEGLPECAKVMHLGTLIKTFQPPNLGFILHSRHQYHWHTGYVPPQPMNVPSIGGVLAKTRGAGAKGAPAYVDIGQRFDVGGEDFEVKAFHTAGFLGDDYGPFFVPQPAEAVAAVRPPAGMSRKRFRERMDRFHRFQALRSKNTPKGGEDYLKRIDAAYELMESPAASAFDLSLEPKDVYDGYNTGRFGLGCLLARRLVEAGSRFVEVTTEYIPFQGWDTHEDGHSRTEGMMKSIDAPIARLVTELEERGLLKRTLVVIASEFSRDVLMEGKPGETVKDQVTVPDKLTEPKHYGLHRHFSGASSVVVFGGGAKRGHVYGETANERPFTATKNPVTLSNLHATFYTMLGIRPDLSHVVDERPVYVTEDGKGKAIRDVMA